MYDSMAAKSGYDKAEELVDVERGRRAGGRRREAGTDWNGKFD